MEWRHEHATLIPAEHAVPGLSQIGRVVYDDGLFGDALIAQCAADARIDAWVERAVLERVDMLIINKFGREEAHGRRLRAVIAEALIAEIPLVIGVSTQNLCDFLTFVGDSATAITAWCRNAIERGAHHRFQPRLSSVQA